MTFLGVLFIPVVLFCFVSRPERLLSLVMVAALFEAGSVFNGSVGAYVFGVQPFYFVEIFVVVRLLILVGQGKALLFPRADPRRGFIALLIAFWAWSFASAFVMPYVFAGVPVFEPPRAGFDSPFVDLTPLHWTISNFAQAAYLTLNVATILYAFFVVRTRRQLESLFRGFALSASIAVAAGLLQRLTISLGWPFPYELFNNNPGYSQGFDQQLVGFRRISSTFPEPSFAGSFLSGIASGLLAGFLSGQRGWRWLFGLLVVTAVLLDTTATTGYVAIVGMTCVLFVYFSPFRGPKRVRRLLARRWIVVGSAVSALAACVLLFVSGFNEIFLNVTTEKAEGLSFAFRADLDLAAITVFRNTYGIGAGLGSNRPSSLVMTFLSSVGIVGTILFATLLYRIVKAFPGKSAPSTLHMTFWSLAGLLLAQTIAIPDMNRPVLWTLMMLVMVQVGLFCVTVTAPAARERLRKLETNVSLDAASGMASAN
jgi:hypothetical protein